MQNNVLIKLPTGDYVRSDAIVAIEKREDPVYEYRAGARPTGATRYRLLIHCTDVTDSIIIPATSLADAQDVADEIALAVARIEPLIDR